VPRVTVRFRNLFVVFMGRTLFSGTPGDDPVTYPALVQLAVPAVPDVDVLTSKCLLPDGDVLSYGD
jgi:hypothetical protein